MSTVVDFDKFVRMVDCLDYWMANPEFLGEDWPLAEVLLLECRKDFADGGVNPSCWFALADLIEERGHTTAIRRHVGSAFDLSSSS